jgi:PAS domain S-box-containing protein
MLTTTMHHDSSLAAFLQVAVPMLQADAATGRFLLVNRALCDLVGRSPDELTSLSYVDVTHPEDLGAVRSAFEACVANASDRLSVEQRIVRPDGSWRWARVTGHVVRKDGQPYRAIGIVEDITRDALERDRLRQKASEAARQQEEFLATLSHELRTPLNVILGWSQLLLEPVDARVMRRGIEAIARNAAGYARLIETVLDVSHVVSGRLELERQSVELAPLAQAALEAVRPAAATKGLALQAEYRADASIIGDPRRLHQVFWNLLSNAVKFTLAGSVRLVVDTDQAAVRVSVEDTGVGIDPDFLPRVFERFSQADGSTTRSFGGLGLGLSLTRYLVEMHGGTVTAESAGLGHGARFTVSFPAATLGTIPCRLPHAAA